MSFKAILAFEDGSVFHGKGFGKEKYDVGELVFNTSMTGYQEIVTDPSYKKQIITFTHPHIGNTGVNKEDNESKTIHASGMVVKNFCDKPSNWRSKATLGEFLKKNEVIGISDIDTREITTILREKGAMNCCIASLSVISDKEAVAKAKAFEGLKGMDLAKVVSTDKEYKWNEGVWPNNNKFNDEYKILVAPGPLEIPMTKDIDADTVLNNEKALNISELASLIRDSSYVVANDTGPAHMAAHLGAKGLTLFGSHTTAYKVSIERENFKAIQVADLNKLTPEKVFEKFTSSLN